MIIVATVTFFDTALNILTTTHLHGVVKNSEAYSDEEFREIVKLSGKNWYNNAHYMF